MKVVIDGKEYVRKRDSGNRNTGGWNSGDWNTGSWNTGYCNSGDSNSGHRNSGHQNSGSWNTGNRNTSSWNTGYCNSGNCNSGSWNTGYCNSGNCNSGNWNTGYWNTGNWNAGDWNTGCCNSDKPPLRFFNKLTDFRDLNEVKFPSYFYFDLTEWVPASEMTIAEKRQNPHYKITNGFLRIYSYKEAWKNSFKKATKEDVALTLKLPNFDYNVFEKISGITKKMIVDKLKEE